MSLRPILIALFLLTPCAARADDIAAQSRQITVAERSVHLECAHAPGDGPHPTALLLHGASGFDRQIEAYHHVASAIAGAGIDACLLYYYSADDQRRMTSGDNVFRGRYGAWVKLVDDVADALARESGRKIALVGFSNGGILAGGAAARDPAITSAVIYYGTIPWPMDVPVRRFPPLLILHGDADQTIPVSEGRALAEMARRMGSEVELKIYPGGWHGFGPQWTTPDGADALARTIAFLERTLTVTTPASAPRPHNP